MKVQRFTVQGVGRFVHIVRIRQAHEFVVETWQDTSEDRDVAGSVKQAKQWLNDRVAELRAAGCIVEPA